MQSAGAVFMPQVRSPVHLPPPLKAAWPAMALCPKEALASRQRTFDVENKLEHLLVFVL
jgi:hypothetical protein